MAAVLLPGKPVADAVFVALAPRIDALIDSGHRPGLATVLVGDDPASAGYIRMKQEKAETLGFHAPHIHLAEDASQADLVSAIRSLNDDLAVDGMLVQHPAPAQIDYEAALLEIETQKNGDSFCLLKTELRLTRQNTRYKCWMTASCFCQFRFNTGPFSTRGGGGH